MDQSTSSLREQITALSDARFDPKLNDFSWLVNRDKRYWGERPELTRMVDIVFTQLGIQAPAAELERYINIFVDDFNDQTRGMKLQDRRRTFGATIPREASVRQCFASLRETFEDFHGPVFDDVLISAECLGYFVIEQSMLPDVQAPPIHRQNMQRPA